jgi:hypothetical protein
MKKLALALLLAAAPAAAQFDPHCLGYGASCCPSGCLTEHWLQAHAFKAHHYVFHEFVPTGTGIGIILYWNLPYENRCAYDAPFMAWTSSGTQYGASWARTPCDPRPWRNLAVWWDDRGNQPRAGDTLLLYGPELGGLDLRVNPTGLMFATTVPFALDMKVRRSAAGSHWNQVLNQPAAWAALYAPAY